MSTVDLAAQILLGTFSKSSEQNLREDEQVEFQLTPFELGSVISFFYSLVDFPSQTLLL